MVGDFGELEFEASDGDVFGDDGDFLWAWVGEGGVVCLVFLGCLGFFGLDLLALVWYFWAIVVAASSISTVGAS